MIDYSKASPLHQKRIVMRKRYLCGVVGIIIFIALGIFALVGVSKIVDDIVLDSVWMDPDKIESWGQNPYENFS